MSPGKAAQKKPCLENTNKQNREKKRQRKEEREGGKRGGREREGEGERQIEKRRKEESLPHPLHLHELTYFT